jgi:hypothetical protein
MDKYMVLDERRNAIDFLTQSLTFLSMVEQNRFYLKWFIIAFHGAIYSFMLLVLQGVNQDQIYKVKPKYAQGPIKEGELDLFDGFLIDFLKAYEYLQVAKHTNGHPYSQTSYQEACMKELNFKLRNQMVHFKPMVSAYEPWYPAEVCTPLLDVLRYCVKFERNYLSIPERDTMVANLDAIEILLTKQKKDGSYLDKAE